MIPVDRPQVSADILRGKEVELIFDLNSDRATRKELIKHGTNRVKERLSLLKIALDLPMVIGWE